MTIVQLVPISGHHPTDGIGVHRKDDAVIRSGEARAEKCLRERTTEGFVPPIVIHG